MDKVEASMNASERQYAELREKTAALSKAKVCVFALQQTSNKPVSPYKQQKRPNNC